MGSAADAVLRAGARLWLPRFQEELGLVPKPSDRARQSASGPDPLRVLLLGNGVANGFGVRTQDLALPGALARALREHTDRGAEVEVDARRGLRVGAIHERLAGLPLDRLDAVVLTVGPTDAGSVVPLPEWRDGLRRVLDDLRGRLSCGATTVVLSVAPLVRSPLGSGWFFGHVDRYAARMDAVSELVVAEVPGAVFVDLRAVLGAAGEPGYASADGYAALAEAIATRVVPRLRAPARFGVRPDGPLRRPESERLDAVAVMTAAAAGSGERLNRLVRSARDLFGVHAAALTLVEQERLHVVSHVGFDLVAPPAREGTLIDRVLVAPDAYVLGNTAGSGSTGLPHFGGVLARFYAGYPIESPSGHRVGALCLFDDRPHDPDSLDRAALRDLAAAVQAELWERAAGAAI